LGSLFAAVGLAATVGASISIHKTRKDTKARESEEPMREEEGDKKLADEV
jgi:hypothetical protein